MPYATDYGLCSLCVLSNLVTALTFFSLQEQPFFPLQLRWKDERGIDIQLTGPPVFLRACVLGQLQHTHLHKPSFPITVNQTLTFDRVRSGGVA